MEVKVSVRCRTEALALMDTASERPITRRPGCARSMVSHFTGPSLEQDVEGFRGAEVAAESSVADEGSVVGGGKKCSCMGASDGTPLPLCLLLGASFLNVVAGFSLREKASHFLSQTEVCGCNHNTRNRRVNNAKR